MIENELTITCKILREDDEIEDCYIAESLENIVEKEKTFQFKVYISKRRMKISESPVGKIFTLQGRVGEIVPDDSDNWEIIDEFALNIKKGKREEDFTNVKNLFRITGRIEALISKKGNLNLYEFKHLTGTRVFTMGVIVPNTAKISLHKYYYFEGKFSVKQNIFKNPIAYVKAEKYKIAEPMNDPIFTDVEKVLGFHIDYLLPDLYSLLECKFIRFDSDEEIFRVKLLRELMRGVSEYVEKG